MLHPGDHVESWSGSRRRRALRGISAPDVLTCRVNRRPISLRACGGGYLCLYVDGDAVRGVVWSSDEAPYLVDHSTYLDIWTNVELGA